MPDYLDFFQHNMPLVLAFVGLTGGIIWTFIAGSARGVTRVSPTDLTRLVNQKEAVVIDIRSDAEFRHGHIVGAINVPQSQFVSQKDKLEKYRNKPLVIVCKTGQGSSKVAGELKKNGFNDLYLLQGGLTTWETASLPLVKA